MENHFWGYHLLLDCNDCNRAAITTPEVLRLWVKQLVLDIEMVPYKEPIIEHFGHNDPKLEGWTVIQLIETSNIIAHFNDHTGEGYIDIFSCRPFDIEAAERAVKQYFKPKYIRRNYLTRQA